MNTNAKKTYTKPCTGVWPMPVPPLAENWSMNKQNSADSPQGKRGYIFSDDDVLSRESNRYWEDLGEDD